MPDNLTSRNRFLAVTWEILTKLFLVSWPLLIGYQVWVVQRIHSHDIQLTAIAEKLTSATSVNTSEQETLRYRITAELEAKYSIQTAAIAAKLEQIQATVIRLEERQRLQSPHELSKSP